MCYQYEEECEEAMLATSSWYYKQEQKTAGTVSLSEEERTSGIFAACPSGNSSLQVSWKARDCCKSSINWSSHAVPAAAHTTILGDPFQHTPSLVALRCPSRSPSAS